MADKVQKIREEILRLHNLLPVMDGDNISVNYADRICTTLEMYIDSLQEEPVSDGLEEAAFGYAESCKYDGGEKLLCVEHFKAGAEWGRNQAMAEIQAQSMALAHGCPEEPANEDVVSVAKQYVDSHVFGNEEDKFTRSVLVDMFCSGAEWKLNQIRKENEKNRD